MKLTTDITPQHERYHKYSLERKIQTQGVDTLEFLFM